MTELQVSVDLSAYRARIYLSWTSPVDGGRLEAYTISTEEIGEKMQSLPDVLSHNGCENLGRVVAAQLCLLERFRFPDPASPVAQPFDEAS